jgi:hypothetical protein
MPDHITIQVAARTHRKRPRRMELRSRLAGTKRWVIPSYSRWKAEPIPNAINGKLAGAGVRSRIRQGVSSHYQHISLT